MFDAIYFMISTVLFRKKLEEGDSFNYLDCAFLEMLRYFAGAGVRPEELDVKLFGGADVRKLKTEAEQLYSLPMASSFQGACPGGTARASFV